MSYEIQQSTTAYPLVFFLAQSADHITGLTGATPTVTIRKVGGSFASPSGAVTEIANGWYQVAGNATDSNTLGPLLLHATATSADPTDMVYSVVKWDLANGRTGPDWANVGSPTTTVNLSGTSVKTATDVETDTADIQTRLPAALVSGRMDASVGAYQTGLTPLQPTVAGRTLDVSAGGEAGIDWANVGSPTTANDLSGTTISTSQVVASVSGAVGSVTARVTANTDQLAAQTVTAAAGVTFPTSVASPTNITAGTITTVTNLTNAPTAGDFTATMKTSIGTAVAASAVASVTAPVTVGTNNDKTGYALSATGSAALTESYAADGAAATLPQLLYMILAMLSEFSISGTTLTAKKLDGSTTAATFTLDDATSPTSITRAT